MTAVAPHPHHTSATPVSAPYVRDRSIDFLRSVCVVVVILIHAQMVGISAGPGGIAFFDASEGSDWLVPFSWTMQVMPLFFLIGGFSGLLSYRKSRARGETAGAFLAARVHRLLLPAVVTLSVVATLLLALSLAGVPEEIVTTARYRFGQPLWFLATFLMCQTFLPMLVHLYERAPWRTLGMLVAAAVAVDMLRENTGVEALGFLNLAFVWLAVQQLGFFLADGRVDRMSHKARLFAAGLAFVAATVMVFLGLFSPNLLDNLNPPSTLLIISAVVQLFLVSLARPALAAFAEQPRVLAFTRFVTPRAMTSYLWHMPVVFAMSGVIAACAVLTETTLPEVSSGLWWAQRPLWLFAAVALTAVVSWKLSALEQRPFRGGAPALSRSLLACAVGAGGILLVLVLSHSLAALFGGAIMTVIALRLAHAPRATLRSLVRDRDANRESSRSA